MGVWRRRMEMRRRVENTIPYLLRSMWRDWNDFFRATCMNA